MGNEYNSRIEYYLDAIANGETPEIKPVNGIDYFLAKIAGMEVDLPTPNTRIEECLAAIAESGGGDFSTAKVTITNETASVAIVQIPNIIEEGKVVTAMPYSEVDVDDPVEVNVVLYKGNALAIIDSENVTVTGDIEIGDGFVTITGDGTITIK